MENEENIKVEYDESKEQIDNLQPTTITLEDGTQLFFNHITTCTMVDGKTINILTNTSSSQVCNVCGITPKDINNLTSSINRPCNTEAYKFGLSVLHSNLRTFQYLLNIAYKLDLKIWRTSPREKRQIEKRKKTNN
ncbi:acetyl-coa c-acyltransferase [Holotrichia oblita]|uniref:Acetyl-coa c-acyltransferase n=1 Tax=Holotrichia oblita TaxID=644536 RepID=A0ACB9SLU9_HOLOL|nr:acetyl-coa c-acyltransferase [Holotrichia oblita]